MRARPAVYLLAALSGAVHARAPIDLDLPDALTSLQARHPAHYEKASSILAAVRECVAPDMAPWIEATFDAIDVECVAWRVSDPPKVRVSFTLDKTRYTAVVVKRSVEPKRLR